MKPLIKLEEAAMFGLAIFLFYMQLDFAWWVFWAWLLAPDLSMIGYLINPKIGAFSYNLVHHKATGIIIWCIGIYSGNNELIFAGILLFGHSSMDRIMDYGLKYKDAFKHTHLGWLP
jgi:hypothetical protein